MADESIQHSGYRLLVQYPLPAAVGVRLEVLGSIGATRLAGLPSQVYLPRLLETGYPILRQPGVLDGLVSEPEYSDGQDPDDPRPESPWGYPTSWVSAPEATAIAVTQILVSFESVDAADRTQLLERSMTALPLWFALLKDWCEVLTGQDLDDVAPRRRVQLEGEGWACWHADAPLTIDHRVIFDLDYGEPLGKSRWDRLLVLVGTGTEPVVEHVLLRDARAAHVRGQYRRAVVDAATALEVSLHRVLLEMHRSSPSALSSELLRVAERWTLGNLVESLAKMGRLPPSVTGNLVKLRNEVIHKRAKEPTEAESAVMLIAAADSVSLASLIDPEL